MWDSTLVSLPSRRIRGYEELYSSDYAGPTLLGLNSYGQRRFDGKDHYLVTGKHLSAKRPYETKEVRVARVVLVKRHIHLRIFDRVMFERSFRDEFDAWLKETEKCI